MLDFGGAFGLERGGIGLLATYNTHTQRNKGQAGPAYFALQGIEEIETRVAADGTYKSFLRWRETCQRKRRYGMRREAQYLFVKVHPDGMLVPAPVANHLKGGKRGKSNKPV